MVTPRVSHTMVVIHKKIYVFGGVCKGELCPNVLHCFNPETFSWSLANSSGRAPSQRAGHSAVVMAGSSTRLAIFGGK